MTIPDDLNKWNKGLFDRLDNISTSTAPPIRFKIISEDDIVDLIIELETTNDVLDFIESI